VLKEHKASICTLGQMKIKGKVYLVSGSDHGCSSVIVWDVEREKIVCRLSEHSAAVTALVDLEDDTHLLSGSYDKKLNIYNMQNQTLVYSLPNNKTSITGAILNSSNNKLITCGLDKALSVWEVHRGGNGKVETISLMRKVQSGCLVCSIVASQLYEDAIVMGDKEGRVKIINVSNGQVLKTINCSSNYLI
jgi:WD40 repeat protein